MKEHCWKRPASHRDERSRQSCRHSTSRSCSPRYSFADRPGFDCILGNPPWEKVQVEERVFWALRFPGLRGLPVAEMNRELERLRSERPDLHDDYESEVEAADRMRLVLLAGPYPDLGSGHPDLYKAFSWRFVSLCRENGRIGVVLPRAALSAAGSSAWREHILDQGSFCDVTLTTNTGGWVFDDAEHRYTIGFVSLSGEHSTVVRLRGPFASVSEYRAGMRQPAIEFNASEFRTWATGAAFPMIPNAWAAQVFLRFRAHPRIDATGTWRVRPVQGDLNATTGKSLMLLDPESTEGLWPVYKGASFNIWKPDTGEYYAWADPEVVISALQERRCHIESPRQLRLWGVPSGLGY